MTNPLPRPKRANIVKWFEVPESDSTQDQSVPAHSQPAQPAGQPASTSTQGQSKPKENHSQSSPDGSGDGPARKRKMTEEHSYVKPERKLSL